MPILDVRKLGRFFSREMRRDQISNANSQIQYAKEHRIIGEREEPALAKELAPRKVKKALGKVERAREVLEQSGAAGPHDQLNQSPNAPSLDPARREPLLLPPPATADEATDD